MVPKGYDMSRCRGCGYMYMAPWPGPDIGICRRCRSPPRKCTRCGNLTKALTYKKLPGGSTAGLCWPCMARYNKIMRMKPEWRHSYRPQVRVSPPRSRLENV